MPEPRRLILDTNLLVSHLLIKNSPASRAVHHAVTQARLLVSEATLAELAEVLARSKFDRYVSREDRQDFIRLLARVAEWVQVTTTVRACRDPKDDKFLELAVDGKADAIVTGDGDLLGLSPFRGVLIVTAAQLLENAS
jgi:putative PIN family toxin of toxin-antitoxin system